MFFIETSSTKESTKDEWIRFRVSPKMKKEWIAVCDQRGESEAELGRKLIQQMINEGAIETGIDEIITIIRSSLKDVIKPTEERLAAINAKTAIASATSMYLNTQVIAEMGHDAVKMYEDARKKAVTHTKAKN